jgi:hypothetical protein
MFDSDYVRCEAAIIRHKINQTKANYVRFIAISTDKPEIIEHNINLTKSGQQLCLIISIFDLIKHSPKKCRTKSK